MTLIQEQTPNASENLKNLLNIKKEDQNILIAGLHLSSLFLFFIVPLILWLINRNTNSIYKTESIKLLNFCLTFFLINLLSMFSTHIPFLGAMIFGMSLTFIGIVFKAAYDSYHHRETDFLASYPFIKN